MRPRPLDLIAAMEPAQEERAESGVDQGLFACFVSAARERGVKRAMALLSNAKNHAAEFQAIVDQCSAPWWNPDPLWQQAKERTASIFGHHAGAAPVPIAKAA